MKRLYYTNPYFTIKDDEEEYLKACFEPVKNAYEEYQEEIKFKSLLLNKVGYDFYDCPLIHKLDELIESKRIEFEMLMKLSKYEIEKKFVALPIYIPSPSIFSKKYIKIF